jgi:hypothetical protein
MTEAMVGERIAVSRALMVVVTANGIELPDLDARWEPGERAQPKRMLRFAEVVALEVLARGKARPRAKIVERVQAMTGAGRDEVEAFLQELAGRGLLVGSDRPERSGTESDPAPVPASPDLAVLDEAEQFLLTTPLVLRLGSHGFEMIDHDGQVQARMGGVELAALAELRRPLTITGALRLHREQAGDHRVRRVTFEELVRRLLPFGQLRRYDPEAPRIPGSFRPPTQMAATGMSKSSAWADLLDARVRAQDLEERERAHRLGTTRIDVLTVHFEWSTPPLSLGMLLAAARVHDGGRLQDDYHLRPTWLMDPQHIRPASAGPAVYLFSHYLWSKELNLKFAAEVKRRDPLAVTIHGGPSVPKYEGDVLEYFEQNPQVDIAVRGEGEVTLCEVLAALAPSLHAGRPDYSALAEVKGITFRDGEGVVRTPDRDRITDLDTIPSPYLTGEFDTFAEGGAQIAIIETNRGCPYGCTFCDWGSATTSRIRKFSLDRVMAELEWCAANRIYTIDFADANFGIFERDVEIAQKVADLKRTVGYPRQLHLNYAKNTVKHLKQIIEIFVGADIMAYGQLSLQTMDSETLTTIRRSNIKLEQYEALSGEFHRAGLPLYVELMMGLPGATVASFKDDLQQCMDREVNVKIYPTELLVNSPMNEPSYRAEHGIEAKHGTLLTAAASFTRSDFDEMVVLRRVFLLVEKLGVLRHVARYLRQETGIREIDFVDRLRLDALDDRERWPTITFTLQALAAYCVPPASWRLFYDELHDYIVEVLGVADDDALDTVLTVQHALVPARGRAFPQVHSLQHDFAGWHRAMTDAKSAGQVSEWPSLVPSIRTYGPATFTVDDPRQVSERCMGEPIVPGFEPDIIWELESAASRSMCPSARLLV